MEPDKPLIAISHVCDAPRDLVYRAFTNPDHLAAWWGPVNHFLPRDKIDFDVRPGGHLRWTEISAVEPELDVQIYVDLTDVAQDERLEGVMRASGRLQDGFEAFKTRFRVEFYDEPGGRTRLEIRQWLPPDMTAPSEQGWREALTKLDHVLRHAQSVTGDAKAEEWRS